MTIAAAIHAALGGSDGDVGAIVGEIRQSWGQYRLGRRHPSSAKVCEWLARSGLTLTLGPDGSVHVVRQPLVVHVAVDVDGTSWGAAPTADEAEAIADARVCRLYGVDAATVRTDYTAAELLEDVEDPAREVARGRRDRRVVRLTIDAPGCEVATLRALGLADDDRAAKLLIARVRP